MRLASKILLMLLFSVVLNVKAQVKINYSNTSGRVFLGIAELLNDENRGAVFISEKTQTHAPLELKLPDKRLCLLGCQGKLYFLWADKQDEFSIDCSTGILQGGDKRIQAFLEKWQELYFDGFSENALLSNMLYVTSQHPYVGKHRIDPHLFQTDDYLNKVEEWHKKQKKMLKKVSGYDAEFTEVFSDYIDYIYWDQLVRSVRSLLIADMDISIELSDKILQLPVEKDGFTKLSYCSFWLSVYVDVLEKRRLIEPNLNDYVYKVATYFKNPALREYYVLSQMQGKIRGRNTIFFRELFEPCRELVVSEEGKKKYENWMEKANQTVGADRFDGKLAAELTFRDYEGNERHLSDYRGKYVYIDLWATWCGPCKQETPHFIKLAERMKGKNLVCLSLSVDRRESERVWKKYVDEHKLRECCEVGWTGSGFSNAFVQYYGINAIPRFMLVGPDGKMIYNNCWRPSNAQIDELLKIYL